MENIGLEVKDVDLYVVEASARISGFGATHHTTIITAELRHNNRSLCPHAYSHLIHDSKAVKMVGVRLPLGPFLTQSGEKAPIRLFHPAVDNAYNFEVLRDVLRIDPLAFANEVGGKEATVENSYALHIQQRDNVAPDATTTTPAGAQLLFTEVKNHLIRKGSGILEDRNSGIDVVIRPYNRHAPPDMNDSKIPRRVIVDVSMWVVVI